MKEERENERNGTERESAREGESERQEEGITTFRCRKEKQAEVT